MIKVGVALCLAGFQPVTMVELAPAGPPAGIDELFLHRGQFGRVRFGREQISDRGPAEEVARGGVIFVSPGPGRPLPAARVEVRMEMGR